MKKPVPVFNLMNPSRAGVSKFRARLETLLLGPTQWYGEIIEGVHQLITIEIGDVKKVRPERVTSRTLQQRLQWTAP